MEVESADRNNWFNPILWPYIVEECLKTSSMHAVVKELQARFPSVSNEFVVAPSPFAQFSRTWMRNYFQRQEVRRPNGTSYVCLKPNLLAIGKANRMSCWIAGTGRPSAFSSYTGLKDALVVSILLLFVVALTLHVFSSVEYVLALTWQRSPP